MYIYIYTLLNTHLRIPKHDCPGRHVPPGAQALFQYHPSQVRSDPGGCPPAPWSTRSHGAEMSGMGIYGDFMGFHGGNHRKTMGKPGENHGKMVDLMGFNGGNTLW